MSSFNYSSISFEGNSVVTFINNRAIQSGTVFSYAYCYISFEGASNIVFSNNNAGDEGGAILVGINGSLSFKNHSVTVFNDNTANVGAAMSSFNYSYISFEGN